MAIHILVINDTQEILELFRDILVAEGYEVSLYSYAIHDMAEIERLKPDLIIVDFLFNQQKEGWQVIQKLKMKRSTMHIPVIVSTAAVEAVREIEGYLQEKGVSLLPKPFDIDDLLEVVKETLKTHPYRASIKADRPSVEPEDT